MKCRIVSHQRISHQQAAVVLARSCVQAKYNHSQRRSAVRPIEVRFFNCSALTGALQFSVELLMDKYGRTIHAQRSSLSSPVQFVWANPFFMVNACVHAVNYRESVFLNGVIFANLFYWIFGSSTSSHFAPPRSHRSSKKEGIIFHLCCSFDRFGVQCVASLRFHPCVRCERSGKRE